MTVLDDTETTTYLPITQLHTAADNLRGDVGELDELVASIRELGILEPLIVAPDGDGYEVLAGNRRLAAAQAAGVIARVPCIIRPDLAEPERRVEVMLVENLQRADLNPLEEAIGYARLAELGLSQRQIAERVGCNQSHVSKRIALTRLPEQARLMFVDGLLTIHQAEEITKVDDADLEPLWQQITETAKRYTSRGEPMPSWVIGDAVGKLARRRKNEAAIAKGEASGLKRTKTDPRWSSTGFERCKKAEATHWYVGQSDGSVTWCRKRADSPASPASTAGEQTETVETWEQRRAREQARDDRRTAAIAAAADNLDGGDLIDFVAKLLLKLVRHNYEVSAAYNADLVERAGGDDLLALALLLLHDCALRLQVDQWGDEVDRLILRALVTFGYELDDEERAFVAQGNDEATTDAGEPAEEADDEPVEPAGEEAAAEPEAAVLSGDCDGCPTPTDGCPGTCPSRTNAVEPAVETTDDGYVDTHGADIPPPPWKAYDFVDDTKLLAGIAEHTNTDKLRAAIDYEQTTKRRPAVLEALQQRIDELDGLAL